MGGTEGMLGKVGILAYGSLIGDAGDEIEPFITSRIACQTPFSVEFARQSRTRKGAPTLVPSELGCPIKAEILVVELNAEEAADRLYRRELHQVGSTKSYTPPKQPTPNRIIIESLTNFEGVATVLYTRIGATILHPTAANLARMAVASASELSDGTDGISYLDDAVKAGIETLLTKDYVAEILRLTGGNDLRDAIERIRDGQYQVQL